MFEIVDAIPISDLTFLRQGDKLIMYSASATSGIGIQSSLHRLFQQKAMKTGQVFKNAFANRYEMPAQEDCIFVFCWALLCVLLAGSWPDLHCHVWGSVRLFCVQALPRALIVTRPRPQCTCSALHPAHISLLSEILSSGNGLVPSNLFPGMEV